MSARDVFVGPDGQIVSIGDMPLELEGDLTRRRVSNILPVSRVKRIAFLALRGVFGESGRVADWTRKWKGNWTCYLFATGETFTHENRQACLNWELVKIAELLGQ